MPKINGIENNTNPSLYLKGLTVSGGPYFLNQEKIVDLRYVKPDFPRMATAIIINISGIPNASNPDKTDLVVVDKSEATTNGIKSGLKNPEIKTMPPVISRFLGGFSITIFIFSFINTYFFFPTGIV